MHTSSTTEYTFAELMDIKRLNREQLREAWEKMSPEGRNAATERLRAAMRKAKDEPKRQRPGPPAFARNSLTSPQGCNSKRIGSVC